MPVETGRGEDKVGGVVDKTLYVELNLRVRSPNLALFLSIVKGTGGQAVVHDESSKSGSDG